MKRKTTLVLGILIAVFFAGYMVTFQVGFHQAAVVTTFGKADEGSVVDGSAEGGGLLGNLCFKWPWPIEDVRLYDLRVRVLEDRLEEQQTRDKMGVVVNAYVTWRITDPLAFFRSLVTEQNAEDQIRALLRDARSVVGNYAFDELTARDPNRLRLARIEQDILTKLTSGLPTSQPWGIRFEAVGVKRLLLPQTVTTAIFDRMRATRERLAQNARSEGAGIAKQIESKAASDRQIILAFAERRAKEIEAEGLANAAKHYKAFQQNEELAVFLRTIETYSEVLGKNTTFVFDANSGLFGLFKKLLDGEE